MFICLYIIYIFITKCCMLLYVYYRISLLYVCFWSLQVFLKFDMTMVYFSMYCCNNLCNFFFPTVFRFHLFMTGNCERLHMIFEFSGWNCPGFPYFLRMRPRFRNRLPIDFRQTTNCNKFKPCQRLQRWKITARERKLFDY